MSEPHPVEPAASDVGASPGAPPVAKASPPPVRSSRAGQIWVAIIVGIVVLALLLVFIFQNLHETTIHFFTVSGSLPVALALLFAAIAGAVIVLLVGSVRIIQLRRQARASHAAAMASRGGGSADGPGQAGTAGP